MTTPFGVATVLPHMMPDGGERPFASKSLSDAENYSQLDKEALAIVFGARRFRKYLYGRKFTLITDHRLLLFISGPKSGVPPLVAAPLQRWSLILSTYRYELEFRRTTERGNADGLSRFPMKNNKKISDRRNLPHRVLFDNYLRRRCKERNRNGPVRSRLQTGWRPEDATTFLATYYRKRLELSLEDGIIVWGRRVIIPKSLRSRAVSLLHDSHQGIVRMKLRSRRCIWWPGLDEQLAVVSECWSCLAVRNFPAVT